MTSVSMASRMPARALLVTSDADSAREIERELHLLGCELVEVAGDGIEARKRCLRLSPQVVLMDLQLSGSAGAIASALELATQAAAPVVFLLDAQAELPNEAFAAGFGVIDKPASARTLLHAIRFACLRHQREQTLRDAATRTLHDEREHAAASRMSGELLSSMAHELRAPLQGVAGFATFLRDGKAGGISETQQQYLDHIASGAHHVLQVVNDVLDLTATESDTLHVRSEVVDPEQAAREVLQVLQVIAIRRRIAVDVRIDEQLGHVVSDATKIKQVLYNFVSNALRFTPAGGRISVSLRREGPDAFCIEVADTGIGLERDALSRLFQAQAHGPGASKGLGLIITKRIVDALGGSVSAQNRAEGGSIFAARLPIAPSVASLHIEDILHPDDS